MKRLIRNYAPAALTLISITLSGAAMSTGQADDVAALIAVDQRQQHAYVSRDWAALE